MRRAVAFALAFACGSVAAQDLSSPAIPAHACRSHPGFDSDQVPVAARVRKTPSGRTYFHDDRTGCPAGEGCARKAYLVEDDEVIVDRIAGEWACAWYAGNKSTSMGYLRVDDLAIEPPLPEVDTATWYGRWEKIGLGRDQGDGNDFLEISERGNVVMVDGEALWFGAEVDGERVVHTGGVDDEILDFDGATAGFPALDEYDCAATFRLVGHQVRIGEVEGPALADYLIADDNGHCGGMNVTFDGIYRRVRSRKEPTR